MSEDQETRTVVEEFQLTGEQVIDEIKRLLHEGNVRRVKVMQDGDVLLNLPLTVVGLGVLLSPGWAAFAALSALMTNCHLVVERSEPAPKQGKKKVDVEGE